MAKTGEEIATENVAAMADLSSEDVLNDLFKHETKAEEKVAQTDKLDDIVQEEKSASEEKPIKETVVEEKPVVETGKEVPAEKEVVEEKDGFDIPGEEKAADAAIKEETESTWKSLAKESLGIELENDTFEGYNEAVNKTIEAKVSTAKELAMAEAKKAVEDMFAKTPEAKMALDFLNNKGTLEEYVKPVAEIEKLQALTDAELVSKDLELRGWDADKIEMYIEDRIEKGKLDLDAYELRKILDTNKANITLERVEAQKEYMQKEEQRIKDAVAKDTTQVREALGKTKEFMDTPISDKHKNFVMQKYEKGEYHELFKNPDTIAEFLLFKEFGKQGVERLKGKSFESGRETIAKKLHNVPPKSNSGGVRTETQVKSHIGNVEALSDLTDHK